MTDKEYQRYMDEISEVQNQNLMNLNEKNFIKKVSLLTPQSYGNKIEKWINKQIKSKMVMARHNRGDLNLKGKYIEVKSSIITKSNPFLNMVQIRLYQDLDYYLCCAFDVRDIRNYKSYFFLLTHDQMEEEMDVLTSTPAHGTKDSIKDHNNIELRYSLLADSNSGVFKRWINKYQQESFSDIITKING